MLTSPEKALDLALGALPASERRADLIGIALGVVTGLNPDSALGRVARLEERERERALRALFWSWAFSDPSAAWNGAIAHAGSFMPWKHIAEQWAERDPHSAFDTILNHPMAYPKDWLLPVFVDWSRSDATSAANWAASQGWGIDARLLGEMAQVALAFLSVQAPKEVPSLFATFPGAERRLFSLLTPVFWEQIDQLVGSDAQAHLDWYAAQSIGWLRELSARRIAQAYVRFDQEAALNWFLALPEKEANFALDPIVRHIDQADPLRAESVVLGFDRPERVERGIDSIVSARVCPREEDAYGEGRPRSEITQSDLTTMREWVATRAPAELRGRIYPLLFICWSSIDLVGAVRALSSIEVPSERLTASLPLLLIVQDAHSRHERDPSSNNPPPLEVVEILHNGLPEPLRQIDLLGAHILYSHYREIDPIQAEGFREASELYLQERREARIQRELMLE